MNLSSAKWQLFRLGRNVLKVSVIVFDRLYSLVYHSSCHCIIPTGDMVLSRSIQFSNRGLFILLMVNASLLWTTLHVQKRRYPADNIHPGVLNDSYVESLQSHFTNDTGMQPLDGTPSKPETETTMMDIGNIEPNPIEQNAPITVVFNNTRLHPTAPPLPPNITITKYNPHMCASEGLRWIIYIHSAPENVERRRAVRMTWGNRYLFQDKRTAIVFLVGMPVSVENQKIIDNEFDTYGDIVQGNFIDSYRNLSLKALMGLKFVSEYCSTIPFAIKADDDAFVNIFQLMQLAPTNETSKRFVACFRWKTMLIYRPNSEISAKKWWLDEAFFPGDKYFPPYCAGIGYMLSTNIIGELIMYSKSTPVLWIDDVYITGMVMGKVPDVEYIDLVTIFPPSFIFKPGGAPHTSQIAFLQEKPYNFEAIWRKLLLELDSQHIAQLNLSVIEKYAPSRAFHRNLSWTNMGPCSLKP